MLDPEQNPDMFNDMIPTGERVYRLASHGPQYPGGYAIMGPDRVLRPVGLEEGVQANGAQASDMTVMGGGGPNAHAGGSGIQHGDRFDSRREERSMRDEGSSADRSSNHRSGSNQRSRSANPGEYRSTSRHGSTLHQPARPRRNSSNRGGGRAGREAREPQDSRFSDMGGGQHRTSTRERRSTISEARSRRFDSQFG
jgi:hypothetical protein